MSGQLFTPDIAHPYARRAKDKVFFRQGELLSDIENRRPSATASSDKIVGC
jgi:hypothetical protein